MIDAFLTVHEGNVHMRISKADNELSIRLGEKVLLDATNFLLGGNACNVAVGMSRAGHSTKLLAEIGEDAFGSTILENLHKENIDTSNILQKGESSFAVGIHFQHDRTLFVQHHEREHVFPLMNMQAKLVFLTSLGSKWHHIYEQMIEAKNKNSFLLAVNPGTPQLTEGRAFLSPLIAVCDYFFVNKEEAQNLLTTTEEDPYRLLSLLHSLGPQVAVLMDGENGAYAQDKECIYFLSAKKCEVVEKTGAGDSWTTGFLSAVVGGRDIPTAMRYGNANAVSVIGQIGAQAGLLSRDMLEKMAGEQPDVEIKQV